MFGNAEEGRRIARLLCVYGFACACFPLFMLIGHLLTMPRSLDLPYLSSRDGSLVRRKFQVLSLPTANR
jgi:hypothetical protein